MSNEKDKQHLQELAAYRFTVDNLRERVAELEAQLAATHPTQQGLEKDAARYRWLRATTNTVTNSDGKRIDVRNQPEVWDKAIDAALAAQAKQGCAANG